MLGVRPPKFGLFTGPHSPFNARFARSQSGRKFPLVSFHERVAVLMAVVMGLLLVVMVALFLATYRPSATLSAVLPSPNRSNAAPTRGSQSFHKGTLFTAAKSRAGTQ